MADGYLHFEPWNLQHLAQLDDQPGSALPNTTPRQLPSPRARRNRFQLPLPDLAALGLGDLAPALAHAQLSLQAGPRPTVTPSELVLGADLVLATPAP